MSSRLRDILKSALRSARGIGGLPPGHEQAWLRDSGVNTVLDIGAHVGSFAAEIRALLPDAMIYAFEPQADSFEALKQRFSADPHFLASQLALADKNEEAEFFRNDVAMAS